MEKQTGQGEQQVSRQSRKGVPKRWTQEDSWSDEEWEDDDHACTPGTQAENSMDQGVRLGV
eukprot:1710816-Rhodomonas_salina.1